MERLSFIIAPYLPIAASFTFAGYQFVPLNELHMYAEGSVLEAARVIAGQHLDLRNNPIEKVTFVFPVDKKLGEYVEDTIKAEIPDMLQILYFDGFCFIDQLYTVTPENFDAAFYNMGFNSLTQSIRAGGVYPQTMIGMNMKTTYYTQPPFVILNRGNFTPSGTISLILAHVVDNRTPSLMNALSFFFEALRNDDRRTWLHRITDLYLAFLMLMKAAPDDDERNLWWNNMAAISEPGLLAYAYPIINTNTGKPRPYSKNLNIVQIWGEEFYKLRCKILHGDKLTTSDFVFSDIVDNNLVPHNPGHFYIGANVFPALFFHKFQKEYPTFPDAPTLIIDNKESFMSRNYTMLGFGEDNYQLPFYVNDISLGDTILKTIRGNQLL